MTEWIEFDCREFYQPPVTEMVWDPLPKTGLLPRYVEVVKVPTKYPPYTLPAGVPHSKRCSCTQVELWVEHQRQKGKTGKEIGEVLGISPQRVSGLYSRTDYCRRHAIEIAAHYIPDERDARYMISVLKGIESAAKEASAA